VTSIEHELKGIRRELDDLTGKFENVSGFRKEIDHALERIGDIEKHLGIERKIAASVRCRLGKSYFELFAGPE
jgi:hypothetical protein